MEKEKFNQAKYMREWQKENMKQVKASYKTEFVDDFKEACRNLGLNNRMFLEMQCIVQLRKQRK